MHVLLHIQVTHVETHIHVGIMSCEEKRARSGNEKIGQNFHPCSLIYVHFLKINPFLESTVIPGGTVPFLGGENFKLSFSCCEYSCWWQFFVSTIKLSSSHSLSVIVSCPNNSVKAIRRVFEIIAIF